MTIAVPDADVRAAESWERAILGTGLEARPNPNGFSRPGRYLIGYVGECGVKEWLESLTAFYQHRVACLGRTGPVEFEIQLSGERAYLEVKTSSRADADTLYIAARNPIDADAYVAAVIVGRDPWCVDLVGWLTRDDVKRLPIREYRPGSAARVCAFVELRPMDALARRLGRRRVVSMAGA